VDEVDTRHMRVGKDTGWVWGEKKGKREEGEQGVPTPDDEEGEQSLPPLSLSWSFLKNKVA
jgi:hypothetical protein